MKLLYMGDLHERANPPQNRIDEDWQATLDAKAAEIWKIAKRNNVSALLQGGDFNDTAKLTDEYQAKIIKRWSSVNMNNIVMKLANQEISNDEVIKELKKGKPIITVAGNHDQYGNSMQGFNKTSLSFLSVVGLLNLVDTKNPIYLKDEEEGFTVAITGSNYSMKMDEDKKHKAYIIEKKLADYHIHIVHGMLSDKSYGTLFSHTLVKDINDTKADLTIAGHDHIGFDPIEIDGKLFVNPGSVIRLSNSEKEMNRIPKVMIIEITKKEGVKLIMKPLKSAKPAEEVLSEEKKLQKAEIDSRIKSIKESIDDVTSNEIKSIADIVEQMPLNETLTQPLKDDVKERLADKMSNDPIRELTDKTPYYIEKIELENFQSHQHSVVELSPHLNVIIGESDEGKSSIMRGFLFVYGELDGAAKDFIRHGTKEAKVTLTLSNGFIISRIVQKKSNGFNGYRIYDPSTKEWTENNTKAIPMVQNILGYSQMFLDDKNHFSVNFLEQDDSHFFIGKAITPSMRAKIIGTVYKTHYGDAVLRDLETEHKKANAVKISKEEELNKLQDEYDCMVHVEPLKERIDKVLEIMETIKSKQALINDITSINKSTQVLASIIERLNDFCDKSDSLLLSKKKKVDDLLIETNKLNELNASVSEFKRLKKIGLRLGQFVEKSEAILVYETKITSFVDSLSDVQEKQAVIKSFKIYKQRVSKLEDMINAMSTCLNTKDKLNEAIEQVEILKNVVTLKKELNIFIRKGKQLSASIASMDTLLGRQTKIDETIKSIEKFKEIWTQYQTIKEASALVVKEEAQINAYVQEYQTLRVDFESYLDEIEMCPVCLHKLDKGTAQTILEKGL